MFNGAVMAMGCVKYNDEYSQSIRSSIYRLSAQPGRVLTPGKPRRVGESKCFASVRTIGIVESCVGK
jgi:hypothetical protein